MKIASQSQKNILKVDLNTHIFFSTHEKKISSWRRKNNQVQAKSHSQKTRFEKKELVKKKYHILFTLFRNSNVEIFNKFFCFVSN